MQRETDMFRNPLQVRGLWIRRVLACGLAAICLMSAAAGAQDPDAEPAADPTPADPPLKPDLSADEWQDVDLLDLEMPMVVTARRYAEPLSSLPYAVSVVTAEDIRRSGARTIADALRLVPGVDVAELSSGAWAISPRGLHGLFANTSLVMVDGRQIFDPLVGGTLWSKWPIVVEDIEQIEVIRGPGGVTWGANAVNGVINIITKDPPREADWRLTVSGGSRGSHNAHVAAGAVDGALRYEVSVQHEANEGFLRGGSWFGPPDDELEAARLRIQARYDVDESTDLTLSAGHATTWDGFPPSLAALGAGKSTRSAASYISSRWEHRLADGEADFLTAYVHDFHNSVGLRVWDYNYQQVGLSWGVVRRPAETHTVSWGLDLRVDRLDATNADPMLLTKDIIHSFLSGLYVEDEWRLSDRWTLSLGGRVEYEAYGGIQPGARASLAYQVSDGSVLWGAVSRAFQMPTAALRFTEIPLYGGLVVVDGARDVDPVGLVAYELGWRVRPLPRLEAAATLFYHDYHDLYGYSGLVLGPPGLLHYHVQNDWDGAGYGAELEARYRVADPLLLRAHYTFERFNVHGGGGLEGNLVAVSMPRHKFMLGAEYAPIDPLHLSAYAYYVDSVRAPDPGFPFVSRTIDAYVRLDLRAEYELRRDRASIAVGVRNLLDDHHPEGTSAFFNSAEVPRMVYAELRLAIPAPGASPRAADAETP
jgi:iron complex outermembrane receptor protein